MMNRNLIAGLFAIAILPATAFTAHAAEPDLSRSTTLGRTYQLACKIGSDGESLQIRMNVHNTSGHVIPKGTPIKLTIHTRYSNYTRLSEAYRDVPVNQTIPLNAPPKSAMYCKASVTLGSALKNKLEKGLRVGKPR
jgi:hypothetical protein